MKKIKWSGDKLLGISALAISLATLISLIYQSRITREHEVKSSFPKLELWTSRSGSKFTLQLVNSGLGPAILEGVSVEYNGTTFNLDHIGFFEQYMDTIKSDFKYERFSHSNIFPGRVVPAGETVDLLKTTRYDETMIDPFDQLYSKDAKLVIEYSSVYEQMWMLNGFNSLPQLIDKDPEVIQSMLD